MRTTRAAVAFLLAQLLMAALYGWTLTERTPVTIWTTGHTLSARAGASVATAESDLFPRGQVGLWVTDSRSLRTYLAPSIASALPPSSKPTLAWLFFGDADSAWDDFRLTDAASGRIVLEEDFDPASQPRFQTNSGNWRVSILGDYATNSAGLALAQTSALGDVLVNVDLVRGRAPAGVLVHADDHGNGLVLQIRPEHGDMLWWRMQSGVWEGPIGSGPFRKSLVSMIQDNLRLLLRAYFAALLLVAGLAVLYVLGVGLARASSAFRRSLAHHLGRFDKGPSPTSAGMPLIPQIPHSAPTIATHLAASPPLSWELPGRRGDRRIVGDTLVLSDYAFLALLFVGAIALSCSVAYFLLERIPHVQDSVAYLFQAKTFALGRLWVPTPPKPEFFEHEFILNYEGKWFSKYPPGHAAVLALGVLAGQPWLVNPIVGALTLLVVFCLGREVYGKQVGLLAACLGLVSPFWVFMSGSQMAHPTALFFLSLFALFFVRGERGRGWGYYPLAGACLGMGVLIRPWTAVGIAAPFGIWALFVLLRHWPAKVWRYLSLLLVLAGFCGLLLAYNAAVTGNPLQNPQELWWPFDRVGFGEGIGGHGPHTVEAGLWNTQRNLTEMMTHLFGWPAYLTLAFALAPFALHRANRWDALFLAAWLSLVAAYVAWWADGVMYGPRFHYESLTFLLLLTARGVWIVGEQGARFAAILLKRGRPALERGRGLALAIVGLLVVLNLVAYMPGQWKLYHGYNYVNAGSIDAVRAAGIHNALVFTQVGKWYEWWNYGSVFSSNSPLLDSDVVYARDLGLDKDRELMQLYPDRKYYLLSTDHHLTEIR